MIIRRSFILEYWVFLPRRRFLALVGQSHISVLEIGRGFDRACGRGVGDYAVPCPLWGGFRVDDCGIIRWGRDGGRDPGMTGSFMDQTLCWPVILFAPET